MSLPFNHKRTQTLYDPELQETSSKIRKLDLDLTSCSTDSDTKNNNNSIKRQTCIAYYMQRDNRIKDNWAYIYAQNCAVEQKLPLLVINEIYFPEHEPSATLRTLEFKIAGLKAVSKECKRLNVKFELLIGSNNYRKKSALTRFLKTNENYKIKELVVDFSPLKPFRKTFLEKLIKFLKNEGNGYFKDFTTLTQVDAHNVVPVWEASNKREYAARTIRPKITAKLGTFLKNFPELTPLEHKFESKTAKIDCESYQSLFKNTVDQSVKTSDLYQPGPEAGLAMLNDFINNRMKKEGYSTNRNNPTKPGALSNLSPWLHHGQISSQKCAMEIKKSSNKNKKEDIDAFIEEAIVRSELSDNFCYYCDDYDNLKGGYDWAQNSLDLHREDEREYLYTLKELDKSKTHDNLWNAAQKQLVHEGKMHGFLRMYWAKKILEWTASPEQALSFSLHLNDRYSLDGNDSNGFTGCMWSIVGVHDNGWPERKVFGKIRFMNYDGCKRKIKKEPLLKFEEKYRKIGREQKIEKFLVKK